MQKKILPGVLTEGQTISNRIIFHRDNWTHRMKARNYTNESCYPIEWQKRERERVKKLIEGGQVCHC